MLILSAETMSGSVYTMTDAGTMVVTRKRGHHLGSRETIRVDTVRVQVIGRGRHVLVINGGVENGVVTSALLAGYLVPEVMRVTGQTWRWEPVAPVAAQPSDWVPKSQPAPVGVAAALAVYGD